MTVRDEHVSHPPRWYANNPVSRLTRHWACGFSLLVPSETEMPTSKQGGGGPRARTRCRPTLSAVSPVPSALKGRGPRLVKAPKTRLMPDPLRDGSWEGGVAKFQRETRFGISEFSGEGKLWRRMEFHRGRIELSGISDERTGS